MLNLEGGGARLSEVQEGVGDMLNFLVGLVNACEVKETPRTYTGEVLMHVHDVDESDGGTDLNQIGLLAVHSREVEHGDGTVA